MSKFYMRNKKDVNVKVPDGVIPNIVGLSTFCQRVVALYLICPEKSNGQWDSNRVEEIEDSEDSEWKGKFPDVIVVFVDVKFPNKEHEADDLAAYIVHNTSTEIQLIVKGCTK